MFMSQLSRVKINICFIVLWRHCSSCLFMCLFIPLPRPSMRTFWRLEPKSPKAIRSRRCRKNPRFDGKMIFYITPRGVMIIESCRILLVLCLVFFFERDALCSNLMIRQRDGGWTIWPGELSPANWYLMSKHGELSQTQGYNPRNSGFPNRDFPFLRRHFQGGTVTLSSNSGCGFTDPWCSWHCWFFVDGDGLNWDHPRVIGMAYLLVPKKESTWRPPNPGYHISGGWTGWSLTFKIQNNWWIISIYSIVFPYYWESSSQLTSIFFRGVGQPPTR